MKKSADSIGRILNRQHNIRIDINKQHTKGNRNKEQGLKSFPDGKIQEKERHEDHDQVSKGQI